MENDGKTLFAINNIQEASLSDRAIMYFALVRLIEKDTNAINIINNDNINIRSISNGIVIETKEQILVSVYNLSGQMEYKSLINVNTEIPLNKGVYIVKVNNESQKVIVR